jgi:hypothetical protein
MTHSLTLKPLPGGESVPAGTAAAAGAPVQAIGPVDLVRRLLPEIRHLISRGYLSLENREVKAAVANALEAWIYDNLP